MWSKWNTFEGVFALPARTAIAAFEYAFSIFPDPSAPMMLYLIEIATIMFTIFQPDGVIISSAASSNGLN